MHLSNIQELFKRNEKLLTHNLKWLRNVGGRSAKNETLNGLNHGLESWEDGKHLHVDTIHFLFNSGDSYTLMQVS